MNDTEASKVVQTAVPVRLYDRFKTTADAKDMSLKEAARKAIVEFTDRYQPIEADDPIFAPLDWDNSHEQPDSLSETVDTVVYDNPADKDT